MSGLLTPFLFQSAAQAITPILLASLAGTLCGRAGVFNLALEGQMLVGAFAAVVGSYFTHSALGGVAAGAAGAAVFSLTLAYGATVFRGDPVVIGIGMNLFASGLTAYLLRVTFGVSGTFSDPGVVGLGRIAIPALIGVPVLGWAFGRQSALTLAAWALTALVSIVVFSTPAGLRLRGVGEDPDAAETLGVPVARYRIVIVILAGALCGLAGAQLSLGAVSVFAEDMSAGRGWIAVVAVMLGRNNPLYAAAACVLFGFADALSIHLQSLGLPNQLTDVAPYVATLAALIISRRRVRAAMPLAEAPPA
jgi:simple sugar transport system permease protein